MNCADAEILICDYATLTSAERFKLERHLGECPALRRVGAGFGGRGRFHGARRRRGAAAGTGQPNPLRATLEAAGIAHCRRARLDRKVTQPVLQPKFAMSMAITILSLAWLVKYVAPARPVTAADFNPVRVWQSLDDRVYRGYQRSVKFYESIKFVYQVRARLQEWNQQQDEEQSAAAERKQNRGGNEKSMDEKRLPVKNTPAEPSAPQTPQK